MRERGLDGLRGWAALFVVLFHLVMFVGASPTVADLRPFFIDGAFAVAMFFVLSGYVLSADFYRRGDFQSVVMLALRRYPRLTIPSLASCVLGLVLMWAGIMNNSEAGALLGSSWTRGMYSFEPSLWGMLQYVAAGMYINPHAPSYNPVLWTMFYELIGSLLVFAMLLATGTSRSARLLGHAVFIGATLLTESHLLGFALGAALADFSASCFHARILTSPWLRNAGLVAILAGLALCAPRALYDAPVLLSVASAVVLYGVLISAWAQRLLSLPLSQELGRLSFPLYLVHCPLLFSVVSLAVMTIGEAAKLPAVQVCIAAGSLALFLVAARAFSPIEQWTIAWCKSFASAAYGLWQRFTAASRDGVRG